MLEEEKKHSETIQAELAEERAALKKAREIEAAQLAQLAQNEAIIARKEQEVQELKKHCEDLKRFAEDAERTARQAALQGSTASAAALNAKDVQLDALRNTHEELQARIEGMEQELSARGCIS
eukprot:gene22887-25304_t